ncbi:MAG: hypothetical protein P9M03_07915 [Candidatus Theseobacter exili]|nr:hypothetical protein [Candidatus Theseobacter exili]
MIVKMELVDAAKTLGITVDGIRKRIKRGTIKAKKNKSGRWVVDVDQESTKDKHKDTDKEQSSNLLVQSMQEQIEYLRAENERKDHIIMSFTNKLPQLAAPKEKSKFWSRFKREKG